MAERHEVARDVVDVDGSVVDEPAEAFLGQHDLREHAQELELLDTAFQVLQVLKLGVQCFRLLILTDRFSHQSTKLKRKFV